MTTKLDPDFKPSDALLRARDAILEHGLAKGHLMDSDGKICTNGALLIGCYGADAVDHRRSIENQRPAEYWDATEPYLRSIIQAKYYPMPGTAISTPLWNDLEHRTAQDVIDAFYEAALLAKEDGL